MAPIRESNFGQHTKPADTAHRWRHCTPLFVAALALVVTGCSGDDAAAPAQTSASSTGTSSTRPSTTPTATTGTSAPASSSPAPSTAPPTTADTSVAEITNVFVSFFNGADTDVDRKAAMLQNGQKYKALLSEAAASVQLQQLSTRVLQVRKVDDSKCAALGGTPPCAIVTHDLLIASFAALPNHESLAIREGTQWKVGAKAWCDVVSLSGATCTA